MSTIRVKENTAEIQRRILRAITQHLNFTFPKMLDDIKNEAKQKLFDSITSQPEYLSIRNGDLRIELGLPDGVDRLLEIIEVWINNIEIEFKSFKPNRNRILEGGIKLQAIRDDYEDVIRLPDAILITEKGDALFWLQWLLTEGSNVIIGDYRVRFQPGKGRTGGGIMVQGGSWGISDEYAGVSNDNFVTRAINDIQRDLEQTITTIAENKI